MAEDRAQRTEEPTPRRKRKAREEGQVASSRDFTSALQFLSAMGLVALFAQQVSVAVLASMRGLFREAFREHLGLGELQALAGAALYDGMAIFWLFAGVLLLVGLVSHMTQTRFAWSPKRLAPDFKRLNPITKLKYLPGDNLAQTGKALLLLPLLTLIFYFVVAGQADAFLELPALSAEAGAVRVGRTLLDLLLMAACCLLILGVFDLWRQRRKVHKKLMMTKQEVRQEQKDVEGDPHIKARLRRLRRDMMRRRMMSEVPSATVVVTNPNHYAVAMRYEPAEMPAPRVVAKGLDLIALRIRAIAEEHEIPIVENPPLAQTLYRSAEIGDDIPEDLYHAVAEILAYIFKLSGRDNF